MPSYRSLLRWIGPFCLVVQTLPLGALVACGETVPDSQPIGECGEDGDCGEGRRCTAASVCIDDVEPGEPECTNDEECGRGRACDDEGRCYECDHEDPASGYAETPSTWDAELFVAGNDIGLDPTLAYLAVPYDDLALMGGIQEIYVCGEVFEGGEVVERDVCTMLDEEAGVIDDEVYLPVGPVEWLATGPVDGTYYRSFVVLDPNDFEPIYLC